jgi:hypothetical protein
VIVPGNLAGQADVEGEEPHGDWIVDAGVKTRKAGYRMQQRRTMERKSCPIMCDRFMTL